MMVFGCMISFFVLILFLWGLFILSRNSNEVFIYNHIWIECPFEAAHMLRHPWFFESRLFMYTFIYLSIHLYNNTSKY